jgi:hypothetical protein
VVVKQLSSGLLLVTGKDITVSFFYIDSFFVYIGPHKLNGVSLRRVNQIYVIATSTKLDLSAAKFDTYDDKFFKRVRPAKKNAEKDIFDSNKEVKLILFIKVISENLIVANMSSRHENIPFRSIAH